MLSALTERLRSRSSAYQPAVQYRHIEAALLAIEAASEVLYDLMLAHIDKAPNPFQAGPDQIRDRSTRKPTL